MNGKHGGCSGQRSPLCQAIMVGIHHHRPFVQTHRMYHNREEPYGKLWTSVIKKNKQKTTYQCGLLNFSIHSTRMQGVTDGENKDRKKSR